MSPPNRPQNNRIPACVRSIDVRSGGDQDSHDLDLAPPDRLQQDRIAFGVYLVDVRASVCQGLEPCLLAPPDRFEQIAGFGTDLKVGLLIRG